MIETLQKAVQAHQTGNIAEAEEYYRAILATTPDQADALALLGVLLSGKGEHAEAISSIEKALKVDPKAALFKIHLGNALSAADRNAEAVVAMRQAIILQADLPEAHFNLGNILRHTDDWDNAIEAYRQAIRLKPNYVEAYNNLALAFAHEKRYDEALTQAQKSVTLAPTYADGWLTLCNVAEQVKDYDTALEAGEKVARLAPNNHKAWFGYGVVLNRLGRHEEAAAVYKLALTLKPERADIWDNLGQSFQSLNRLAEAETTFRKTIEVAGQVIDGEDEREVEEKEYGNRHWHLSLIELLQGKYKLGFARYRARFEDVGDLKRPATGKPLWCGEDLTDKTILIGDEQGFGDTLMFARYLPLLKEKGAKIIFSVHPALGPLFIGWSGVDRVVVHGFPVSNFDYHAVTFDLPHRFGTTLETVPNTVPYLPIPLPDERTALTQETGPLAGRPRIGVVWGGNPHHKNDENRSIPLKIFSDILFEKGAQFFSLNRDVKKGDNELFPHLPLTNLGPRIKTFADSARYVQQLDLIITCDTATAHLAGGMGKPVWVLLPFAPDWRWLLDRSDSPWYPTMRLFRQKKTGDWTSVTAEVKAALEVYLAAIPPPN